MRCQRPDPTTPNASKIREALSELEDGLLGLYEKVPESILLRSIRSSRPFKSTKISCEIHFRNLQEFSSIGLGSKPLFHLTIL